MTVIHSVSPKVNHLKGKGENYILGKMDFMRMEWEGRRKEKPAEMFPLFSVQHQYLPINFSCRMRVM